MAYTPFVDNKPVGTDTGLQAVDYMRENLMAMRDAVVMGAMKDWNYAPSGADLSEPDSVLYSKGTERLRGTLTWTSGNVTTVVWAYSSNSGTSYDTIGTESIGYDGNGNVTGITWS